MAVARSGNRTGPAPEGPDDGPSAVPAVPAVPAVEVRRSGRRRRTVSAYREDGRTIVLIPARFTKAEERHWVDTMLGRLAAGDRRRRPDDTELSARARALSERYLAETARPTSVSWVGNQMSRWGSCTPADGTIRISERLKGMPGYVLDYVLLHELAHLLRPAHDGEFWELLRAYPRVERARGYLEGVAAVAGLGAAWQDDTADGEAGRLVDLLQAAPEPTTLF